MDELQTASDFNPVYQTDTVTGDTWTAMLGDSCQRLRELDDNSIDLSVYSPPFADLYTYSNSEFDLGNSRNYSEFFGHYAYIIREVLRVTKPGRSTCVHVADIPAMAVKDGYIRIKDFPGAVVRARVRPSLVETTLAKLRSELEALALWNDPGHVYVHCLCEAP